MALSNYDLVAVNEKGQPINGIMVTPAGVQVEIYKNWVYIRDKRAWRKDSSFVKPTVMHLQRGSLLYLDLNILVLRGPQGGAYVIAWYKTKKRCLVRGMIGCGTHAYTERKDLTSRVTGVMKSSTRWFRRELNRKEKIHSIQSTYGPGRKVKHKKVWWNLHVHDVPDEFRSIDLSSAVRFNQGDAFFAKHLGSELPATKVGRQRAPMFDGMLKKIFKKKTTTEKLKPNGQTDGT